ncbi:O-acetyl-ADP-ribose deacetylase 1-like [Selaginella moellendorffii]|uniref:O-acetyl-ADP-ribose deacetylase 1-like n=1 Tax=Selaginella moellendorffii TaxID=88036 RepID=UPI000D1CDD15|nr:O-acetyl-ADP-ribose deacetylase 1-like [Selaginella moellendorffii]|eukprot:XP_024517274.1 O-acetyl-ADP-ribose deacetylase 1-like [Selaginella moellendorffii]
MEVEEIQGDLFEGAQPTDGLVHCVSKDLHMSKGIAARFRDEFRGVDELRKQNRSVGEVAVLDRPPRAGVFYLVTKLRFFDKPTLASLQASLEDLRRVCEQRGVCGLSMPRIGCGLDKLGWEDVKKLIYVAVIWNRISSPVKSVFLNCRLNDRPRHPQEQQEDQDEEQIRIQLHAGSAEASKQR